MKKSIQSIGVVFLILQFSICGLNAQKLDHILNEALVKLEFGTDLDLFQKRLAHYNDQKTEFQIVRKVSKQLNIYLIRFDQNAVNEYDFRNKISKHPNVEVIQVNHVLTKRETTPNDPLFATQWQWQNVAAELAWDTTTGGTTINGDDIVIAIFDDGGDLDHPDLINNNWINVHEIEGNDYDDDGNGYIDDIYGWNFSTNSNDVDDGVHGVNVAGMAGAVGNNTIGGTGMNWNVKLMNLGNNGTQESNVLEFYSYALDMRQRYNETNGAEGAFVVATNTSWGIDEGDPNDAPLWCEFYNTMGEQGILSCAATANDEVNVDDVGDLPTTCPSEYLIAVTSTDINDDRLSSAYGPINIDVGAPGENVYTTQQGGGYQLKSGTSFAAPLTAGLVALMYSTPCPNIAYLSLAEPALAAEMVRDYIYDGSQAVGNLPGTIVHGRVNAANSIQLIMDNCGPCPSPAAIAAKDIIDIQSNISWVSFFSTLSTNLRWRLAGTANWNNVTGITSPYLLTGLTACTEYEIQLNDICANEQSGFTDSYFFTSEGCCVAPDNLVANNFTINGAAASWASVFAAESYHIRIKETAGNIWEETNITNTDFNFTGLTPCTEYEIQIQTICTSGPTNFSERIVFATSGCGACLDLDYCAIEGDDSSEEWIESIEVNTLVNVSGMPSNGYTNFTGMSTDVEVGAIYDLILTPGYNGQSFGEYWTIYIDYNQDGTFDQANELAFDAGATSQEAVSGNFTIPSNANAGLTRMRIIMRWNVFPPPCEDYGFGETEDYCINITGCGAPSGLDATNIDSTTTTVFWNATTIAIDYDLRYKRTSSSNWISINTSATSLTLVDLTECTDYEFQVKSNCIISESDYSASTFFTTTCTSSTTDIDAGINQLTLQPNPFNDQLTTEFELSEATDIKLELFSVAGQKLYQRNYHHLAAGTQNIRLSELTSLSEGIYFLTLTTKQGTAVRKVIKN